MRQLVAAGGGWAPHGSGFYLSVANLATGRTQLLNLSDTHYGALLLSPVADAGDTSALALLRSWELDDEYDIEIASTVFIALTQPILADTHVDDLRAKAARLAAYADSIEARLDPREDKW